MTPRERQVLAVQIASQMGCTVEEALRALLLFQDDEVRARHYLRFTGTRMR